MDEQQRVIMELPLWKILLIGLAQGIFWGLLPLILGFVKKKPKLGLIGFFATAFGGFILGSVLALPIAIVFVVLILRRKPENVAHEQEIV